MAIVSFVVSAATGKVGARYAAMMFMVPGVYASYVVGLAWVSNTLPRPAAKVSDFLFFFFPSNSGREKKKKAEVSCHTSASFWAEKATFVVKIISVTIFSFEGGEGWCERGILPPPPSSTSCEQRKSILLIYRGVRYTARRGSGIDQRRFKLILHLRLIHVSQICESKIR